MEFWKFFMGVNESFCELRNRLLDKIASRIFPLLIICNH